jgi:formylmethanofuran dehydrogenase subunit C
MPDLSIIYVDGNATFTAAHPLSGGGAIIVNGDLTLSSNSSSYYSGLVLVNGDFTMHSPSLISGSVIVLGDSYLAGTMEMSEIIYEDDILSVVRQKLGQYRFSRAPYHAPNRYF